MLTRSGATARYRSRMGITLDEVALAALALPDVIETDDGGKRLWSVRGKVFVWERSFSKADIRRFGAEVPPAGVIVAARVASLDEKDAVLSLDRPGFFTIPHFANYPAVLVQLEAVDAQAMREAIGAAWQSRVPHPVARRSRTKG